MHMKRSLSLLVAAAVLVVLPACKFAKIGARCTAAQGAARTNTHVLFCVGGKWKQSLTIGQAAEFIIGQWPGTATSSAGDDLYSAPGLGLPEFDLTVTNRAGRPAANTPVTLSLTGPGISGVDRTEFRTDARGIFRFVRPASVGRGGPGVYTLTWSGPHPTPILTQRIHRAGLPASVVLLSGGDQTVVAGNRLAPMVFEVRDANGTAVRGARVRVAGDGVSAAAERADGTGRVTVESVVLERVRSAMVEVVAYEPGGPRGELVLGRATTAYTVTAGPLDDAVVGGDLQTATVGAGFSAPLWVRPVDAFGNPVSAAVTFTAVPGPSGASGTLTPAGPSSVTVIANGIAGEWAVRAEIAGLGTFDFELENLPV